jgi:stringent starvation protein B
MAFPVAVTTPGGEESSRPSPLSSVPAAGSASDEDAKVVQLVTPEPSASDGPEGEPPRPPTGPRPALKRVK